MTILEAKAIIERISYKPSFKLGVSNFGDKLQVSMGMAVVDSTASGYIWINAIFYAPWNGIREVELVNLVRRNIAAMEEHEMDEWLRLDGKNIINPHKVYP